MKLIKRSEKAALDKKGNKKALIAKLDRAVSKFIRHRDTLSNGIQRYGKCCTCGMLKDYAQLDCGHFISRRYYGTRWSEINCNVQCRSCNRFHEGLKDKYAEFLKSKYGESILITLEMAKKNNPHVPKEFELQARINHYESKINPHPR